MLQVEYEGKCATTAQNKCAAASETMPIKNFTQQFKTNTPMEMCCILKKHAAETRRKKYMNKWANMWQIQKWCEGQKHTNPESKCNRKHTVCLVDTTEVHQASREVEQLDFQPDQIYCSFIKNILLFALSLWLSLVFLNCHRFWSGSRFIIAFLPLLATV